MVNVYEIINNIEKLAPLTLASSWDNSGWQICLDNYEINKVLIALSPTEEVINQAVAAKCQLIITHHPLLFGKTSKLDYHNPLGKAVITAIKNNINIYSCHTNLDAVHNGVAEIFARLINLKNVVPIEVTTENLGFGRKGELDEEVTLAEFIVKIKNLLNIDKLKLINPHNVYKIKNIAVCPGSGGDFIPTLKGIDLFITADVKYHSALEIGDFAVIDAGHLETERIILPILAEIVKKAGVESIIADEKPVWQII